MSTPPSGASQQGHDAALAALQRLRRFSGPPAEFWSGLVDALAALAGANRALLILCPSGQPDKLRKLGEWNAPGHADRAVLAFNRAIPSLAEQTLIQGQASEVLETGLLPGTQHIAIGVGLQFLGGEERCLGAFLLLNATGDQAREALVRLQLAADTPFDYQTHRATQQARVDVEKFASVLDVLTLVNAESRFLAASLALCNGLATQFRCERVSLGWLESDFVRLKSISRTERFDKRMLAVKAIETVMEEAVDQDEEVVWPAAEHARTVVRDHERFAREQSVAHAASIPIRSEGRAVAALTCERQEGAFTETELQQLRLAADQVAPRLADLHRRDRWFGARWGHAARERFARLVGPRHTWPKVLALLGCAALVALFLPIYPFRVEGNFILRSEEVAFLTAPFDGYIQSSPVRPGDVVAKDGPLLQLNTDQLVLEEASAIADQTRYLREAEKARAAGSLAEMRIAQALAEQAAAQLGLVRYRLRQAGLRAPFDSVVVEGDLRQRIGAPVRQGEALFKLARIDTVYVEAEINERDVHEIAGKTGGEIAFVAQPKLKFPIRVVRLEPAAQAKENENVFILRGALVNPPESWWRPGMSGICKIDVERRTLFWIATHRTVDFLRLFFWW